MKLSARKSLIFLALLAVSAIFMSPMTGTAAPKPKTATITGSAVEGQTLTAVAGGWPSGTTYSYQWQRCTSGTCTAIAGATSSMYLLTTADVGSTIRVIISASGSSATSAQTAVVQAAPTYPGQYPAQYPGDYWACKVYC